MTCGFARPDFRRLVSSVPRRGNKRRAHLASGQLPISRVRTRGIARDIHGHRGTSAFRRGTVEGPREWRGLAGGPRDRDLDPRPDEVVRAADGPRGHHLRHPQGQDHPHARALRNGQVRVPQEHHGPAEARAGRDLDRRPGHREARLARAVQGPPQVRGPVPGRRALRLRLAGRRLGHQARARIGGMAGTPKQSKPPKQSMLSDSRERRTPLEGVGDFIRSQRQLARLSLRQVAERAKVSNPYLSQIERGIYRPSAEVLKAIAGALDISAETLFARIGLVEPDRERPAPSVEEAIRLDPRLSTRQKETLLSVYRDFTGRD